MSRVSVPCLVVPCVLALLSCSTAAPRGEEPTSQPVECRVTPEEISGLPLHAKGCVAVVDGVRISPRAFNVRTRTLSRLFEDAPNPVAQMDRATLEELGDTLVEELVKGEVLTQELDRVGFTVDDDEHRRLITRWLVDGVDYETYVSTYLEFVRPDLTREDLDAMNRGWSRARGYVCSLRVCEVTREQARTRYEEEKASSGATSPFDEVAPELIERMEREAWAEANASVLAPLMAKAEIEAFPENIVIDDALLESGE